MDNETFRGRYGAEYISTSKSSTTHFNFQRLRPATLQYSVMSMDRPQRVANIEEMMSLLVRSKLLTKEQTVELFNRFRDEYLSVSNATDTITSFCTFLVGTGVLTSWQCEKLRDGQWKGYFDFDNFVMLDKLNTDADFGYYLARDVRDGTTVILAMTPLSKSKSDKLEFHVHHSFH